MSADNDKYRGTNVLYFTSACNLACEYCYEKKDRERLEKDYVITKEKIDEFYDKLIEREGLEEQSVIVLFGGEPTLVYDLVEYAISTGLKKKQNLVFCFNTNGIIPSTDKGFERLKGLYELANGNLTTEVSYDVSGNYRRVDKNGKRHDKEILRTIQRLDESKLSYRIRITIHKGNYKNIKQDIIKLILTYSNVERIVTSFAYSELEKEDFFQQFDGVGIEKIEQWISKLKPFFFEVFFKYHKPICALTCEVCQHCKKLDYSFYYTKTGELVVEKGKQGDFKHFSGELK